jgi:hypothetical protein
MCHRSYLLSPYRPSIVLIAFMVSAFFIHCDKSGKNPVLAKFDGGTVLESEYIDHFLLSTQYKPKVLPTEENLKEIVVKRALDKISVAEAVTGGLDQDTTFQTMVQNQGQKIVFYRYMQQEIISQVITDSLIQEFYNHFSPQYHMKYIIRPVVKSSTAGFERSQKDTIEFVNRLLKSGKKFEDLAKKYSQDITTNQKGGDLGFVIRESLGDAALRAAMDSLKDFAYSEPFRGYEGYYILYKGEKRVVPVPALAAAKDRIWQTLYRTRRHNIRQAVAKRFQLLAKKYNYEFLKDGKKAILAKVGANENSSEYKLLDFSILDENDLSQVLAKYDGGVIRVSELFENRKREPQSLVEFNERHSALAEQHLLGQHGLELGIQNEPEITTQIKLFKESLLRNNLMQRMVRDKANAKVDSLKETLRIQEKPEELKKILSQKYFEYERELKQQFEEKLKNKYQFQFVTKNFNGALEKARLSKVEQNKKTLKPDPNKATSE